MSSVIDVATRRHPVTVQMVILDRVRPNRYRRGVISEEKVEALVRSIETSGFWDGSIQGRLHPDEPNCIEIAFGHHRLEAARRKGIAQIGVVVSERSNDDMMRMMADENRAEFKHDAAVAIDTIAAVIEAWGAGEINLEPVAKDVPKHAIHNVAPGGATYTLATVSRYLGWTKRHGKDPPQPTLSCRVAFDAYHEVAVVKAAENILPPEHRDSTSVALLTMAAKAARAAGEKDGLKPAQVRQAEKLAVECQAKEIIERGSSVGVRDLAVGIGKAAASEVAGKKPKPVPHVEVYIDRLIRQCIQSDPIGDIKTSARRLVTVIDHVPKELSLRLARELEKLLERVQHEGTQLVKALRSGQSRQMARALQLEGRTE